MNQLQDIYNDYLIDPAFSAYFDLDEYLTGFMTDEYYTIKHHNEILNKFKLDRLNEIQNNFFNFDTVTDEIIKKLEPLLIKKFSKDENKFLHFNDHEQEEYLQEQYEKIIIEQYENHFLNEFKNERYDELKKIRPLKEIYTDVTVKPSKNEFFCEFGTYWDDFIDILERLHQIRRYKVQPIPKKIINALKKY
jgi:hypothetical protein